MKKSNPAAPRAVRALVFLVALITLFGACSTLPKNAVERGPGDFDLLPGGGQLYLWANVPKARPLLESISLDNLSLKEAGAILDHTQSAAAVFLPKGASETVDGESGEKRFLVSLGGKFPVFQAGVSMTFSSDWNKRNSATGNGNSFWYSNSYGIGLALAPERALVAGGDPFVKMASSGGTAAVIVPANFEEFRGNAVMAGWIPEPAVLVNEFLASLFVPIQLPAEDFFFTVNKQGGGDLWDLTFRIRTASVNQARALVTLFSLAKGFVEFSPPASSAGKKELADFLPVFFANLPEQNGAVLTLKSAALPMEELALLFNAVSVYSQDTIAVK